VYSFLLRHAVTKPQNKHRFASIIKPPSFYIKHGDIRNRVPKSTVTTAAVVTMTPAQQIVAAQQQQPQRCYFYNIDLHGRLYLEENPIKNITSSIKDMKFLDFFFAHIKYINETHQEYMRQHDIPVEDYPFVSICQREWNFIRPAATPIVFHSLIDNEQILLYGSSNILLLREPLDETSGIVISKVSGKLYHKLTTHSYYPLSIRKRYPSLHLTTQQQQQQPQYALIRSTIALSLSDRIVDLDEYYSTIESNGTNDSRDNRMNNDDSIPSRQTSEMQQDNGKIDTKHIKQKSDGRTSTSFTISTTQDSRTTTIESRPLLPQPPSKSSSSGLGFITKYNRVVPIMYLPSYAEPGPYSMSSNE
jgi:hypothetical protein